MHKLLCTTIMMLLVGCDQETGHGTRSVLRLAVTTSTQDSGLLDTLLPMFESEHAVRLDVVAVGTGAALKLGEAGDVDVILVHARSAEDTFMKAGHAVRREDVMYNTFDILGPDNDPAEIRSLDPAAALQKVAAGGMRFVSRGDNSGTHQREATLWRDGGSRPEWDGYVESGQGMGRTLTIADHMNAHVLCDHGTFLKFKTKIRLVPLVTSMASLHNPYGILVVNPDKHPGIHGELAHAFVDFIISSTAQKVIGDYEIDGEQLFYPLRLVDES